MDLNLLVPGLAWTKKDELAPLFNQLNLPALNHIKRFSAKEQAMESLSDFYQYFLPKIDELNYFIKQQPLANDVHYILASPVSLRLNRQHIDLADADVLNINQIEAEQICTDLNQFLTQEQWQFIPVTAKLWILKTPKILNIKTTSLHDVAGNNIMPYQPQGPDSILVQKILTEIQMLLCNHPVNQQRKKISHPMINAIWLWHSNKKHHLETEDRAYFIDNPIWQKQLNGFAAPHNFQAWEKIILTQNITATEHYILLEDLLGATQYQDIWGYQDTLVELEQRFFQPALRALKSRQFNSLKVCAHGPFGGCMQIKAYSHYAFWKKKQNFNGRLS